MTTPKKKPAVRKPTKAQQEKLTREELLALLAKKDEDNTQAFEIPTTSAPVSQTPLPAAIAATPAAPSEPVTPTYYARNLREVPVSFRLVRQKKGVEDRTDLGARSGRNSIVKLEDGDLKDPKLAETVSYGLVEIITEAEAVDVMQKQAINHQAGPNPLLGFLRSENDQPYAQESIQVKPEAGQAAIGVGTVLTETTRTQNPIVRPGTEQGVTQFQQPVSPVDEQARDAAIRANKQAEGIEAGLGGLTVAPLAPVQQSS